MKNEWKKSEHVAPTGFSQLLDIPFKCIFLDRMASVHEKAII